MNSDLFDCDLAENISEDDIDESSILKLNDSHIKMPEILYSNGNDDSQYYLSKNSENANNNHGNWGLNSSIHNSDMDHLLQNDAFDSKQSQVHSIPSTNQIHQKREGGGNNAKYLNYIKPQENEGAYMDNAHAKTAGGFQQNVKLENILEIVSPSKLGQAQTIDHEEVNNFSLRDKIISLPQIHQHKARSPVRQNISKTNISNSGNNTTGNIVHSKVLKEKATTSFSLKKNIYANKTLTSTQNVQNAQNLDKVIKLNMNQITKANGNAVK